MIYLTGFIKRVVGVSIFSLGMLFAIGGYSSDHTVPKIQFLNSFSFPSEFGGKKDQFIGISSLSFDAHDGVLFASSDDSGFCKTLGMWNCPDSFARMYTIRIEEGKKSPKGELVVLGSFNPINPIPLLDATGFKTGPGKIDVEGMTATHDGHLLMISEQDISAPVHYPPKLYLYERDGKLLQEIALPKKFFAAWGAGCQRNKCFEGVSLVPGSDNYIAVTEQSLVQDKKTKYLRFIDFKLPQHNHHQEVALNAEYAYEMAALEEDLTKDAKKVSRGVSDILAFAPNDFLVIERSFIPYQAKDKRALSVIRLFRVSCDGCTDIKEHDSLDHVKNIVPMKKTFVLDMLTVNDETGKPINDLNIEGMSWGPKLSDGSNTLIFSSDNGDNTKNPTRFLIFKTDLEASNHSCNFSSEDGMCHSH